MESYPSHLKSIPRSIGRLKHYFDVHDQPFARSAIYLAILALLGTALATIVAIVGYAYDTPRHAKELEARLAGLRFEGGKLAAEGDQPRVLWEDTRTVTVPIKDEDGKAQDHELKVRRFVVVLDTTGVLKSVADAAELIGCAEPAHYVFFGAEQVMTVAMPAGSGERPQQESFPYTDAEKLKAARELVEKQGGQVPEFTVKDGAAEFALEGRRVHVLRHTAKLMLVVDASGEKRPVEKAMAAAFRQDPAFWARMRPPEFLLLLTAEGAYLKPSFAREATAWAFSEGETVTAASLAGWAASEKRSAQIKSTLQQALPTYLLGHVGLLPLFVGALLCSVAGLLVNVVTRAGLAYGELLTIAVYAVTPALVVFLIAVFVLRERGGQWVLAVGLAVGMAYTALATHRTARALADGTSPTI